jgi:hypothetical protein
VNLAGVGCKWLELRGKYWDFDCEWGRIIRRHALRFVLLGLAALRGGSCVAGFHDFSQSREDAKERKEGLELGPQGFDPRRAWTFEMG